ncbi:MAG: hypothetical protein OEY75_11555 [Hylemonella sp.]|nr:hypothetical protein [Hylemonella sp.]
MATLIHRNGQGMELRTDIRGELIVKRRRSRRNLIGQTSLSAEMKSAART